MEKKGARVLGVSLISLFFIILITGIVSAALIDINYNAPENAGRIASEGPSEDKWYGKLLVDWLGFGETWALVISSILVMLIIISGLYDILSTFSAFRNKYVIFIISAGVGIIAGFSGAVRALSILFFSITGGLGALSIVIGILIPLVIFVLVNVIFLKFFRKLRASRTIAEADTGATTAASAAEGLGKIAGGFRKAGKEAEKE